MRTQLTAVPQPAVGETFTSWMDRLAAANWMPVTSTLYVTGIAKSDDVKAIPTGYGHYLTGGQLESLSFTTSVAQETISAMLTTSWVGTRASPVIINGQDLTRDAKQFAHKNWVYANGSHYCPQCLKENQGAWLLEWKIPFVWACTRHNALLQSSCPECNQRAAQNRRTSGLKPEFPTHIPKPGTCKNTPPKIDNKNSKGPCGHKLTEEPLGIELPVWLLTLQQRILDETMDPDWWGDIRSLATYAMITTPIETIEEILCNSLPETLQQVWVERQTAALQRLEQDRASSIDYRSYAKDTTGRKAPDDPHLMATATAVAYACKADNNALKTLIQTGKTSDSTGQHPQQRLKALGASGNLQEEIIRAYQGENHSLIANGLHSRYAQKGIDLDLNGIPPYMWSDIFDKHLAPLTEGLPVHRETFQRFASIAVRKAATGETWEAATSHFIDRHLVNPKLANTVLNRIATAKGKQGLATFLHATANVSIALRDDPRTATYAEVRRNANKTYAEPLTELMYRELYPDSTATESRRKWGAVQTWATTTSDHRVNAPAWGPNGPNEGNLESYRRWVKQQNTPPIK